MKNVTLYLAHPFEARKIIRKMQKEIESEFKIRLVNPFYDAPQRDDIEKYDRGEIVTRTLEDCKTIRNNDLELIKSLDGILAIIPKGYNIIGTYKEIFYCYKICKKPVYLICPESRITEHLWHKVEVFKYFKDIHEYREYLVANGWLQK